MDYFTREVYGDVAVEIVEISRCTVQEAQQLQKNLTDDFQKGFNKIIVDLKECEFMDSTFLSTLVTNLRRLLKSGGNLKLCGISYDVQSLLELTGTHKVFEIYKDRKEAVKSFKKNKL